MPSTARNSLGLGRRLAREQFGQRRRRALARIFLHQLFDQKKRLGGAVDAHPLACGRERLSDGRRAAMRSDRLLLRQQVAQGDAEPRRRAHQFARIGMFGLGEDIGRERGFDHAALLHHHHAIAIGRGQTEIMRDQDRRHAALSGQFDDEVHHRLLGRDVEAGGRLVGDQKPRTAGQRQRDHDPLAHAARQLERIGMIALARPRDLDLLERRDRPVGHLRTVDLDMLQQHVLDLVADLADRVERQPRALEDHRHFAAAHVAHLALRSPPCTSTPENMNRAVGDLAGAIENPHHRIGRHRLAGTGLADNAERLALGHRDIDVLHRLDDAAPGRELHGEVVDVEQRHGHALGHRLHALTSSAADRPGRAIRRRAD